MPAPTLDPPTAFVALTPLYARPFRPDWASAPSAQERLGDRRAALRWSVRVSVLLGLTGLMPSLGRSQSASSGFSTNALAGAFEARTLAELSRALGVPAPIEAKEVTLQAPDMAENGAAVPVTLSVAVNGVKSLLLLVEKNPHLLAAAFELSDALEPAFTTRIKLQQSSNVFGVALLHDGRTLFARREVKVTLGGCAA